MKNLLVLALIIVLGSFLRLQNISAKELWYDEAFTAEIINNSFSEVFTLSKTDVHPPLYYMMLKTWTDIFGDSELILRLPSVIFGVSLIPLVYFLVVFMTLDKKRSLIASLIIAVNPFLVTYSREARSYSLVVFLIVLTFFVLIKTLKTKKYLALSLLLPLLFLTHYITVFIIIVFAGILLFSRKKTILYLVPLMLIIVLWLPIIAKSSENVGLKWIPKFDIPRIPQSVHAFILGVDNNNPHIPPPLNPFPITSIATSLIIFSSVSLLILVSKPTKDEKLLLICAATPMVLTALTSLFLGKHLFVERFLIGFGALLIIYCVSVLPKLFISITLPYILLSVYLILSYKIINSNYRELVTYQKDKQMVMADASEFINIKYYSNKIKLQEGDWSAWGIIKASDIFYKRDAKDDFYLVSRGPIKDWKASIQVDEFYFYDWNVN